MAQQGKSGQSTRVFCREHGLSEPAFYAWRQRLRSENAVGFALVETKPASEPTAPPIELLLAGGDRLLIPSDPATLRVVLAVLRDPV